MRRALIIVAAVITGCQHVGVTTQGALLARHVDELHGRGYAEVEVEQGGTVRVAADDRISVVIPGDQESHLWGLVTTGRPDEIRELTVGSFLTGCARDATGADCLAARTHAPIAIGTQRRLDATTLVIGVFGAIATTIGITCLATCSNLNGWAWLGTGLGIATFVVPLSTVY